MCTFVAVATLTGCSRSEQPDRHSPTVGDFCTPLLGFFKTDFPIAGVRLWFESNLSEPVKDIKDSALCTYSAAVTNPVRGASWLAPVKNGEDPAARITVLKDKGYKILPGHSAEIWFQDSREKRPETTKGVVNLATEIGPWQGSLEILNETGTLAITDEQVSRAADLLIHDVQQMNF